ncbi:hypothetical protein CPB83DRAFT_843070 [Crepidotus variabilis]|uniref:Complex 1 LYR protein n=1 Tax=Crepidotus variabilis TaxID=179855 RepID=A0A9P6ERP7_9AGAR|nr:hypothetical protein CPB83DRAFT_843070 [Crepidotus variabilis]
MLSERATIYRVVLRELRQSLAPERRVNRAIVSQFRSFAERIGSDNNLHVRQDFENAVNFLRAQRQHKALLDRYNPLFDLTAEERIEATARRVGLNMPKTPNREA